MTYAHEVTQAFHAKFPELAKRFPTNMPLTEWCNGVGDAIGIEWIDERRDSFARLRQVSGWIMASP